MKPGAWPQYRRIGFHSFLALTTLAGFAAFGARALVARALDGQPNLDEMVSRKARIDGVNEAFRAMKAGEVARTVLMFDN